MTTIIDIPHTTNISPFGHGGENDVNNHLTATAGAAFAGAYGLSIEYTEDVLINCYTMSLSNTSGTVRCRFYFNPNSITMASNDNFPILWLRNSAGDPFAGVSLGKTLSYWISIWGLSDAPAYQYLSATDITDDWHYIELLVTKSSGNNGTLYGWIDGVAPSPTASITNIDNDTRFAQLNSYRFGVANTGKPAGTSGTFFMDELVINDDGGLIGPLSAESSSVSPSISPSYSISPSASQSPSSSVSSSVSPSVSKSSSVSPSVSKSSSVSPSISPSRSVSSSISPSYSISPSISPSFSVSPSFSISPSFSVSPSISSSVSSSVSSSISPSVSQSFSVSTSVSSSVSASISSSASVSPSVSSSVSRSTSSSISRSTSASISPSSSASASPSPSLAFKVDDVILEWYSSSVSSSVSPSISPSVSPSASISPSVSSSISPSVSSSISPSRSVSPSVSSSISPSVSPSYSLSSSASVSKSASSSQSLSVSVSQSPSLSPSFSASSSPSPSTQPPGPYAFGEQNPTQGESPIEWQTWSDGSGGIPTITGDANWGKLHLEIAEEGRSEVYDLGDAHARKFTMTENLYGSGSGSAILQIRGDTVVFSQDDGSPAWESYTSPITRTWRYVQVRETTSEFPLGVSGNGRYVIGTSGDPFFLIGDSAHGLFFNISLTDAEEFISSRAASGVNALWVQLLPSTYSDISDGWKTYDNIAPFSWDGSDPLTFDLSSPNETYFARIDDMLDLCARYNICAFLDPTETGGWLSIFKANSQADRQSYGTYLGNRYKNRQNIVWQHGNDFQTWSTLEDDNAVLDIVRALAVADTNHLATIQFDYSSSDSGVDNRWTPGTDWQINSIYAYYPQYDRSLIAYNRSGPHPTFFIEGEYENQTYKPYNGPHDLRAQEYWTLLSGVSGHFWGSADIYPFASGWNNAGWDTTQGFLEFVIFCNFLLSKLWYNLEPDQDHSVLTAGYGTYSTTGEGNTSDYCTCARVADGSLVMAYMPVAQTMTIDMTKLRGQVTARWFDPTNGVYYTDAASPLSNTGTHDFSRAGANSVGDHDYVLVLEA